MANIARATALRRHMKAFICYQENLMILALFICQRHMSRAARQRRMLWIRPRSQSFFSNVAMNWDDVKWRRNFRVGRPTF